MIPAPLLGAGGAVDITPPLGRDIQGASVFKKAASVRDPLEANLLYLHSGAEQLLLISVDVVGLLPARDRRWREQVAAATGVPLASILLGATHTHNGPSVIPTCYVKPVDDEVLDAIGLKLADRAREVVAAAVPVRVSMGQGAAELGYNRRCCWADGSHSMHGNPTRDDFTGLEGPADPTQTMLAIANEAGEPLAIWHCNTSHPTCFYGKDFYSADFPGVAREAIRGALGESVAVLFFNGAFGDISVGNMHSRLSGAHGGEATCRRAGLQLAGETLRLYYDSPWQSALTIAQDAVMLDVTVRLPDPAAVEAGRATLARLDAGETVKAWDQLEAWGAVSLQDDFGANPVDSLALHAVRLGDLLILTEPCELFCQFGIDLRRRSPAPMTAICGIVNGYHGYVPTTYGAIGGGYSGAPIWWTRMEVAAGYRLVDRAAALAHALWRR